MSSCKSTIFLFASSSAFFCSVSIDGIMSVSREEDKASIVAKSADLGVVRGSGDRCQLVAVSTYMQGLTVSKLFGTVSQV